ncbi:phasin family protein [Nisaea nitritireducens]|uniref:phasin family protein n=1 Tax=Nisaea nitritireducens TaxID=568392 RepID=UPI001868B118|nr:phasin family protein [Nisaea nitritireducens]
MVAKKTTSTAAAGQVEDAVAAGKETVEAAVKATQEVAEKSYGQAVELMKEHAEKAQKALYGGYDEYASLGKANYDAYVTAMNTWSKGFEAIGKELYAFGQESVEVSVETGKTVMGCKTVNELMELQNDVSKKSYDKAVGEITKISEMSVKTANEAIKPIQESLTGTFEKLSKPIAA